MSDCADLGSPPCFEALPLRERFSQDHRDIYSTNGIPIQYPFQAKNTQPISKELLQHTSILRLLLVCERPGHFASWALNAIESIGRCDDHAKSNWRRITNSPYYCKGYETRKARVSYTVSILLRNRDGFPETEAVGLEKELVFGSYTRTLRFRLF